MKETDVGVMSPTSKLDWKWDWSMWLVDGDTIVSCTVTGVDVTVADHTKTDDGMSIVAVLVTPTKSRVSAVCHIVTAHGLDEPRTLQIQVRRR